MKCAHRWNCDVTPAKCLYCGDERTFKDSPAVWNGSYEDRAYGFNAPRHATRSSKRYPVDR